MNIKVILALLGVMLFGAGLVMAVTIDGAKSVVEITNTHWTGDVADSLVTEGGNITNADVNSTTLTDRWAAFWGTINGSLKLTNGTYDIYEWTWTPAASGVICLSTNASATTQFGGIEAAVAGDVDTAFGLNATKPDSATSTFTGSTCLLQFADNNVTTANSTDLAGWNTCVVDDGAATPAEDDLAFCQMIVDGGTGYDTTSPVNYEIMVPTTPGEGNTETYYFYVELN